MFTQATKGYIQVGFAQTTATNRNLTLMPETTLLTHSSMDNSYYSSNRRISYSNGMPPRT